MASRFRGMASSVRASHAHYFAAQVTYHEPGDVSRTADAVLKKSKTESRTDDQGRINRVTLRECRFVTLTDIRHDAVITADGMQWSIDRVLEREASGLHVMLQRIQTNEINRPSYRGKG
ncbi:hypothetical protein [Aureliella helgolandensis]|uniref:Phage head-tail joining protein n=1 Tax=Aureliella helgolandensis TaxID=2527968 RepID=A0A518G2U6_9BACT|nr:hypothetical protein [Aureliella helgolandensis]QDV22923.1 hypothetical protein Q31a_12160 [Aureliella helgolandensis]